MLTSRATRTIGLLLGLTALVALVGRSQAQNDPAVKKANSAAPASPATAPPASPRIGTIDVERVFKEFKKVKDTSEKIRADAFAKQNEMNGVMNEMKQIAKEMESLNPNQPDFQTKERKITELKARVEAEREQAQAEFQRREAEALAQIFNEVQRMTRLIAEKKGLNLVVKVSNESVSGSDPNSVMAGLARSVVYADGSMDITELVIRNLNYYYDNPPGAKPRPASNPAAGSAPARSGN